MNYKDTLLMPKTDFEMRGNLPKKEPKYVERWQENDMYNKVIQQNEGKDSFVFHDGPPYANGNMHMGHMLNKVIKDVISIHHIFLDGILMVYQLKMLFKN